LRRGEREGARTSVAAAAAADTPADVTLIRGLGRGVVPDASSSRPRGSSTLSLRRFGRRGRRWLLVFDNSCFHNFRKSLENGKAEAGSRFAVVFGVRELPCRIRFDGANTKTTFVGALRATRSVLPPLSPVIRSLFLGGEKSAAFFFLRRWGGQSAKRHQKQRQNAPWQKLCDP
jgi:hypothetical protein